MHTSLPLEQYKIMYMQWWGSEILMSAMVLKIVTSHTIWSISEGRFQTPAIELSAALFGPSLSIIIAIPIEELLVHPIKFTVAIFLATLCAVIWRSLFYFLTTKYFSKPRHTPNCINVIVATLKKWLPKSLERFSGFCMPYKTECA